MAPHKFQYLLFSQSPLLQLHWLRPLGAVFEVDREVVVHDLMLSILGIGALSAAIILSEYGDFDKFDSPAKLLSFAGLEPGYFQSGQSEHSGRMVKHGSSHLRYAVMNCCLSLITHEPVFAEYYAKKRAEGKPHRVAMTHVAKKLLRVIYTLQNSNVTYDPDLIR